VLFMAHTTLQTSHHSYAPSVLCDELLTLDLHSRTGKTGGNPHLRHPTAPAPVNTVFGNKCSSLTGFLYSGTVERTAVINGLLIRVSGLTEAKPALVMR